MSAVRVCDVMTREVVVATAGCRTSNIIDVLTDYGVSGLPVVDDGDRVIGVVSEADLLAAIVEAGDGSLDGIAGHTARQLMSSPPVVVGPDDTVSHAAGLMAGRHVKRLPVVEPGSGRLVGIVTRGDLLRRALRSDAAIEREVVGDVVQPAFAVDPARIEVGVRRGVVTLRGDVERRSAAMRLVTGARAVDGVGGVVDELHWRLDDTHAGGRYVRAG